MDIRLPKDPQFNKYYTKHCKYLKLKGLLPSTSSGQFNITKGRIIRYVISSSQYRIEKIRFYRQWRFTLKNDQFLLKKTVFSLKSSYENVYQIKSPGNLQPPGLNKAPLKKDIF